MSGFSFSMTKRREGKFFLKDLILLERIFRFEIVESLCCKKIFRLLCKFYWFLVCDFVDWGSGLFQS